VEQALPVFEDAGDDLALSTAYRALGQVANMRAQMDMRLEANERALIHLRRAGIPHHEDRLVYSLALARFHGSTSVPELLEWLDEQEAMRPQDLLLREAHADALAMLGRFDEARTMLSGVRAELADRGAMFRLGDITSQSCIFVEMLAGNPAAAVELGEEGCRMLEQIGERSYLSTAAGMLGQAFYALDRLEEADAWAGRGAELGASDDAITQMLSRQVRAKVLARRGDTAEAERLAREAVAVGEQTDMLNAQGDTHADLAEVLLLAGGPDQTAAALEQALERYERKGNRVSTQRAQTRLAEFQDGAPQ
jgi:tetratricopeptide (TPR) repeat protein